MFRFLALTLAVLFMPAMAYAACSSPAGVAGEMYYNTSSDVYEYCDDTNWISTGSTPTPPTTSGLVGHWELDETTGSSIADSSVNSNTGTWSDGSGNSVAEETTTGQVGDALDFDGTDDDISIADDASLKPANITLAAWVYADSTGGGSHIMDKQSGSTGYGIYLPSGNVSSFVSVDSAWDNTTGPALSTGTWYHIAATYDGTTHSLYVDGALADSNTNAGTLTHTTNSMNIGTRDGGGQRWNGIIDDVRVYDRALSASEINDIYSANNCGSSAGTEGEMHYNSATRAMEFCDGTAWIPMGPEISDPGTSNLVAHWEFDETSGTTASDSTGNTDNDGTLMNDTAWSASGIIGGAVLFDGTDDHIDFPNAGATGAVNNKETFAAGDNQTMTITGWTRVNVASNTDYDIIVNYLGGNSYVAWEDGGASDRPMRCMTRNFGGGANYFPQSDGTMTWDNWVHFAYVVEDGVGYKYYLDGTLDKDQSTTDVNLNHWGCGTMGCHIGQYNASDPVAGDRWGDFNGYIDDLRIYNRELTDAEILHLYDLGATGGCTSPAGVEGEMLYDSTDTAMEYCNGLSWVSIGK